MTNNFLQLLARIYDYSPQQASHLLSELTDVPIDIGIEINQQTRGKGSVPDGAILQRSFKILIEAKVDAGVDADQLIRHTAAFSNEAQRLLLLLTRQQLSSEEDLDISNKVLSAAPGVIFKSVTYERVCRAISGRFKNFEYEMTELCDDFVQYCNDVGLFDQSGYLLRIVPCGESFELNKKYGVYFAPSDRSYTNHRFIGIYAEKRVLCIWELESVIDVTLDGTGLHKTLVAGRDTDEFDSNIRNIVDEARKECGYEVETGHRFFCGRPCITDYIKTSPGGIQGPRFVNLSDVIGEFSSVDEIAAKLRGKSWE